jgi:hypothetical protein
MSIKQYSVAFADNSVQAETHKMTLASLPNRFKVSRHGPADIVFVSANDVDAVKLSDYVHADTVAIVVSAPASLSTFGEKVLGDYSSSAGRVVPQLHFSPHIMANPATKNTINPSDYALVDSQICLGHADFAAGMAEQLAVFRHIFGPLSFLEVLSKSEANYRAVGRFGELGQRFHLGGYVKAGASPAMTFNAVGKSARIEIVIESGATARPARVLVHTAERTIEETPPFQSAQRLTWARLHENLSSQSGSDSAFQHFMADVHMARKALA